MDLGERVMHIAPDVPSRVDYVPVVLGEAKWREVDARLGLKTVMAGTRALMAAGLIAGAPVWAQDSVDPEATADTPPSEPAPGEAAPAEDQAPLPTVPVAIRYASSPSVRSGTTAERGAGRAQASAAGPSPAPVTP